MNKNCKPTANRSFRSAYGSPQVIDFIGGRTRTRTLDPLIKSQLRAVSIRQYNRSCGPVE
jgi:hypothetical protein